MKREIIFIGSGIGALTAAALLSKKHSVLVLEKNPVSGGYAVNFRRKNFIFDASLHALNSLNPSGILKELFEQIGIDSQIKTIGFPYLFRTVFPGLDFRIKEESDFIKVLKSFSPSEQTKIDKFFEETTKFYKGILDFEKNGKFTPLYLKSVNTTCDQFADQFQLSTQLKTLIFQQSLYYFGLPPSQLPLFYFVYPFFDYLLNGGYYLQGGSQALTDQLVKTIINNGSHIINNAQVKRILTDNACARGIVLEDGRTFSGKIIVSGIDLKRTFSELVETDSENFKENIFSIKPSISAFQVYLGLNKELAPNLKDDYEIFISKKLNIEDDYRNTLENNFSKCAIAATIYSNFDNSCAPAGKTNIVITTFSQYAYWSRIKTRSQYAQEKNTVADALIKSLDEAIPNIRENIEVKESASPLTMERYTGNSQGAIYGAEQSVLQTGWRRPDFRTPIKNLFLVSAWTRPGGGIRSVMLSGKTLSQIIEKNFEKTLTDSGPT